VCFQVNHLSVNIKLTIFVIEKIFLVNMSEFKFCSNRTKRRRVAAEVAKIITDVENDSALAIAHSSSAATAVNDSSTHLLEGDLVDVKSNDSKVSHFSDDDTSSEVISPVATSDITCSDIGFNTNVENVNAAVSDLSGETWEECEGWNCRPVSECEDDGSGDSYDDDDVFEPLASWAVADNIAHASVNRLLAILKKRIPELPADARTLLQTRRNVATKVVAGGEYYYFGIKYWLQILLNCNNSEALLYSDTLHLNINIDGIPLFNSSNVSLWPILGLIREVNSSPFPIAIFCSKSKPSSLDEYLHDYITEMNELINTGFGHEEKIYHVTLGAVICDAPARAFLKCIKTHSGYDSCERCLQSGEWCNKVILPSVSAPLRTDASFISQQDPKHHVGKSPLLKLADCRMVSGFPLDYMHLVCLGVVRRLMHLWINGTRDCKLSQTQVALISEHLVSMKRYIPREFARRPRSLSEYKQWKATELRLFLLYVGPVCLKGVLSSEKYSNFLDLSVAMRLLLSPQLHQHYLSYSEQLLQYFVSQFGSLYGKDQLVYNVHSLVHLPDDVRNYGILDNVSAFPFESYLGRLKKLVRRPQMPCAQIVRRVQEGSCQPTVNETNRDKEPFKRPHMEGPLPVAYFSFLQYKQYFGDEYFVSTGDGDNCCIIEGKVGIVKNILVNRGVGSLDAFVVFEEFENKISFFTDPLDSQLLSICVVDKLSGFHKVMPISHNLTKCLLLPFKSRFVVIPQMHYS